MYEQKMERGMGDQGKHQRRTNNCRSGPEQTNFRAGQRMQFRTSKDQDHDMNRTMQGYCCGMVPVIPPKTRVLKESGQVNNGSVHGQNQYRVWHVIAVWFRTGQDRSKSWAAQIQARTRQDQCRAQYKQVK